MNPTCRLLPTEARPGPANMAADEAMLLAADRGVASLRFYTWSVPTLSLGYFQSAHARLSDPLLADAAWVRRPSGGAAILHHRELTYCLALPAGAAWQSRESWICRFHHMVAAALSAFGVKARAVVCGEEKKLGELLCFLHQTPGDLLVGPAKIGGSAQRKLRGALMQHGSILLQQSPLTPSLPGIAELSGVHFALEEIEEAILGEFRTSTGWRVDWDDWSANELEEIERIMREKYSTPAWNEKR